MLIPNVRGLRGLGAATLGLGVGVFLVLALFIHLLATNHREANQRERRESVNREVSTLAAQIQLEISANVFLANGMVAYLSAVTNPSDAGMEKAMAALFRFGRHLRNIGIAPDNRIRYVYPLRGNESIIGLYYPDVPEQWTAVQAAIANRETVVAGPLPLRQGGLGLISRTPVFLENGDYWGILSLVLDADHVLQLADAAQSRGDTEFAIRGGGDRVFWGNARMFSEEAVIQDLPIPGGKWQIAGRPQLGWTASGSFYSLIETGAMAAAALISIVIMGYHHGRRKLGDAKRELSGILESVVDGVITIDEAGVIHAFNLAAERIFGFSADEARGRNITLIMAPEQAEAHSQGMRRYLQTNERRIIGSGTVTVTGRRKDGSTLPLDLSLSETLTTRGRLFTGIIRDATERVRHETELKDGRAATERRAANLAALAEELEIARREAEEANRAKSRFLAVISHELRTPLTGVLGTADLLLGSSLDPGQAEWTKALKGSGESLLHLLDDILDYSKVEAGHLAIEQVVFDPSEPMREVVQLFRSRAGEKGVALEAQTGGGLPEAVSGDPTRLRQILLNLVGNAVKFTAKGTIAVRLAGLAPTADAPFRLRFEIADSGVGISDTELARLFQPFTQADASTTRRYGGTGLGLAICKHLTELMGGEIGCASTPGEGSTFWFTVAVAPASTAALATKGQADAPIPAPSRPLDVLVAEDNEVNRMLLCETLERQGHTVIAVENGELAVGALAAQRFDILLIDKQMPVMDGLTAARTIRAAEADPGALPIVMLTADVLSEPDADHHKVISATLSKPIDWARLAEIMDALCSGAAVRVPPPPAAAANLAVLAPQMLDQLPPARQASILRKLSDQLDASLVAITAALDGDDPQAVRRAAHSLVGMAGQTGLERVAHQSREILERDKAAPPDPAALARLDQEIAAAKAAITDRLAELENA